MIGSVDVLFENGDRRSVEDKFLLYWMEVEQMNVDFKRVSHFSSSIGNVSPLIL